MVVFSTPSGIYAATGNVGVSVLLWVVGGLITFSGLSVLVFFPSFLLICPITEHGGLSLTVM